MIIRSDMESNGMLSNENNFWYCNILSDRLWRTLECQIMKHMPTSRECQWWLNIFTHLSPHSHSLAPLNEMLLTEWRKYDVPHRIRKLEFPWQVQRVPYQTLLCCWYSPSDRHTCSSITSSNDILTARSRRWDATSIVITWDTHNSIQGRTLP